MNGFLNFLKPTGMTSHQGVAYFRKLLGVKKVGHGGTLDPGAAGVLPICLGKGTKAAGYLLESRKVYRAEMNLGITTDTQDAYGKVLKVSSFKGITPKMVEEVIKIFKGKITQIPPMFSAVKHKGKPLYKLARKGEVIHRKSREAFIYSIDIIDIDIPKIIFDVDCSKGTYVRTLVSDMGEKLGVGAHLSFLLRIKSGPFHINNAFTKEEVKDLFQRNQVKEFLIPLDTAFTHLPEAVIKDNALRTFINGNSQPLSSLQKYEISDKMVRVYSSSGEFLALGKWQGLYPKIELKPEKLFLNN